MFITDVKVEPITLDDTVEIVELSRPSDDYFASVINHNSLAIFDDLESILLDNHNGQERRVVTELSSNSDLLKATLTLSHAEKLVIVTTSSQFNVKGEIIHAISGTLALCQAFISLGKEVTLIIDEGDEKLYSSCIEHMVEIGAFKSGMLPAIVIENKLCETFEQSPSVYDCILAIEGAGPTCSGTPKIYNLSPLVHELYEMLCTNARHNIKIIRVSDIRGDESGLRQEKSASADYHIVAGNSDWVGYALACGLYVASTSPFHWRYRNYAINADKPPQFNVLEFLPSIEQVRKLFHYLPTACSVIYTIKHCGQSSYPCNEVTCYVYTCPCVASFPRLYTPSFSVSPLEMTSTSIYTRDAIETVYGLSRGNEACLRFGI